MEVAQVLEAQVVPHVQPESQTMSLLGGTDERSDSRLSVLRVHRGVRFSIEFHTVGSRAGSTPYHFRVGIDEDTYSDALFMESVCHLGQEVKVGLCVPTMVTGQLSGCIGHEGDLRRHDETHQVNKLRRGIAFDVKLRSDPWTKIQDVLPADMPLVGPRMYGNTLSTEALTIQSHADNIGVVSTARIAQRGNLIDIYTQFRHTFKYNKHYFKAKLRNYCQLSIANCQLFCTFVRKYTISVMQKVRFAIFGNIYQARKSALAKRLLHGLETHGAEILIDRPFHEYLTHLLQEDIAYQRLIDGDEFTADYAVSMGGDGTFLHTAARIGCKGIPIIGVNMGRMGFLADISADEIETAIKGICEGKYRVEERSVLQVDFHDEKGYAPIPDGGNYALNEVAVLKRDSSSMISIRVALNGEYLTTYQADGLIVSTPTGSTGYALSVGGPIMAPEAHTLGITPVAPHSLNVRPIVIYDNMEVSMSVESRSHNFLVSIDGRSISCSENTSLSIRRAPHCIRILKRPQSSFFCTLREKLMWGSDVRVETLKD